MKEFSLGKNISNFILSQEFFLPRHITLKILN